MTSRPSAGPEREELQRTPLTGHHEARGARLGPFGGWLMPIQFAGTVAEHHAVRERVGAFDVSHLGTVWVEGAAAVETVAATFTNDPTTLDDGGSQYTLCCDERGGIVDDLIVYRLAADRFLAVPNAANTAPVVAALRAAAPSGVTIRDQSIDWGLVAVQGPDALRTIDAALARIAADATSPAAEVPYLSIAPIADGEVGYLARTGYTGEPGGELLVIPEWAPQLWTALLEEGATACGLGARDTLRLEMGYPLHGNDLSTDVTPYEARVGWAVRLDRGDFGGRRALVEAKASGPQRRLWGLRGDGRRPPRQGMTVRRADEQVGVVTSGTFSPTLEVGIGMAYLDDGTGPGDQVTVDVRGSDVAFEVVKPPFVDRDPRP